jgi:hypothetical protein
MVNNRMYCEYYKLFGIVSTYLIEIKLNYENKQELLKNCPIYKDLEPMFEYDIGDIENIYSNTILLITHLYDQTLKNIAEIDGYDSLSGFSISNFINTLRNENLILQGQIDLFMNYLSFFITSQQKQYSRINARITNFLSEFDEKTLVTPIEEPIVEPIQEPIVEPIEEPVNEPIEEPVVIKKSMEKEEKKESPLPDMAFE